MPPSEKNPSFRSYAPEGGLSQVFAPLKNFLAPDTNTWGEALGRLTPVVSDYYGMKDATKAYNQGDKASAGVSTSLSMIGMGGLGTMIGKKGAANLEKVLPQVAESQRIAERAHARGAKPLDVWQESFSATGYPSTLEWKGQGVNTEISDRGKFFDPSHSTSLPYRLDFLEGPEREQVSNYGNLPEFFNDPVLTMAYPEMRDSKVKVFKPGVFADNMHGYQNSSEIGINGFHGRGSETTKTMLHERQHLIDSLENHPGGTSPEYLAQILKDVHEPAYTAATMLEISHISKQTGMPPEQVMKIFMESGAYKDTPLFKRLPEASLLKDPYYRGYNVDNLTRYGDQWFKDMLDYDVIPRVAAVGSWSPGKAYRATVGEEKARLAEKRRNLTQEQLGEMFPFWDEYNGFGVNTPADKHIVRDPRTNYAHPETEVNFDIPETKIKYRDGKWVHEDDIQEKAEGGLVKRVVSGLTPEQAEDLLIQLHSEEPKKFANGGLVGNNPFVSQSQGLFAGLDLIHPKNNGNAPLDIPMNNNNMLANSRAGTAQAQHYSTR